MTSHNFFFAQKFIVLGKVDFLFLSVFFIFIFTKKNSPIFEMLSSIQRTGCEKLLCMRSYAKIDFTRNSQNNVFFYRLLEIFSFSRKVPCQTWNFGSNRNRRVVKIFLHKRLRLNFLGKNYNSRKCQLSELLIIFWTFLDNSPAKADIIGLID